MRNTKVFFLCLFLVFSLFTQEALSWGCKGHMLVAEIARRHLTEENRRKADEITRAFSDSGPFPHSPDFVQASCWPDDLKGWHMFAMKSWHYVDQLYNPQNISTNASAVPEMNVITAIESMMQALRMLKSPAYVHNFALVNLVHFVGDIHQPLHAIMRCSKEHPHGDAGGNTFTVWVKDKKLNLHRLWDDICDANEETTQRPLSLTDYTELKAFADYLEDTYKFEAHLLKEDSIKVFADESYEFGVNTTYKGIEEGEELFEDYLTQCRQVAEARVTLAGRRLGNILNKLLEDIHVDKTAECDSIKHIKELKVIEKNC